MLGAGGALTFEKISAWVKVMNVEEAGKVALSILRGCDDVQPGELVGGCLIVISAITSKLPEPERAEAVERLINTLKAGVKWFGKRGLGEKTSAQVGEKPQADQYLASGRAPKHHNKNRCRTRTVRAVRAWGRARLPQPCIN